MLTILIHRLHAHHAEELKSKTDTSSNEYYPGVASKEAFINSSKAHVHVPQGVCIQPVRPANLYLGHTKIPSQNALTRCNQGSIPLQDAW